MRSVWLELSVLKLSILHIQIQIKFRYLEPIYCLLIPRIASFIVLLSAIVTYAACSLLLHCLRPGHWLTQATLPTDATYMGINTSLNIYVLIPQRILITTLALSYSAHLTVPYP